MCQNCNNNSCGGCSQQCYQFPPPPGPPGQVGPPGPQGPPGACPCPLSIIPVTGITQLAVPYNVTATDDIILVDSRLGVVDIFLLPANNPLIFNRKLVIKDAFGSSGTFAITIQPAGLDTIDFPATVTDLFTKVGAYGSIELVSNRNNGYNII